MDRWDFNFHNPQNQIYQKQLDENVTKTIGELVEICMGSHFRQEDRQQTGKYKILSPRNIINGILEETINDNYLEKIYYTAEEENAILRKGDILFPRFIREKVSVYIHPFDDNKYIANQHIIIFRGKNTDYVATYLNTDSGLFLFNQQINRHSRGNLLPTISLKDLRSIQIPILPLIDLEYASKSKLEKISYYELLEIKEKYDKLKVKYSSVPAN